ncbi:MAG TPA: ATP-binding protein [Xanthobacteraceae bacterium]|jgi:signal transduction histidine kinase
MSKALLNSLQLRLALRLAALYIVVTGIAVGILVYQAYETAGSLNDRELSLRAADLARAVKVGPDGQPQVELPPMLAFNYESRTGIDMFAIRGPAGQLIGASPAEFGEVVAKWPPATDEPNYFRINSIGSGEREYYGLNIQLASAVGPLAISVAQAAEADVLIDSLLREFVLDLGWIVPILVLVTLGVGILAVRSGLKPVRQISEMAAAIGPGATSIRLPDAKLPSEIVPLVAAMNRALDRLEKGFEVQRQFTANAAHELRTPLSIITAALDGMEDNDEIAKLKSDVARMSRLVNQLLSVARLDAIALDVCEPVDLNDVAAGLVASLAPWALTQKKAIGFSGSDTPVLVKGNRYAIENAIRNLIENAIAYSPAGSEVTVATYPDGRIIVADQGPGIPPEHRSEIFQRFWRGKGVKPQGAGLGLAIVNEIMKAHHGTVSVEDKPDGGAVFTLRFTLID